MVKNSSKFKKLLVWTGIILGFFGLFLAIAAWLILSTPSYWRPLDPGQPQIQQTAQSVENFVTTQTTMVREGPESWSIELTEDQVNSWLAVRLPMWLENQSVDAELIRAITPVMLYFRPGSVELAMRADLGGLSQVLLAGFTPLAAEDDRVARLRLSGLYAGRMPIPMRLLVGQLRRHADGEDVEEFFRALDALELRFELGDGRVVEVHSLVLSHGAVVLNCRTGQGK